MFKKVFIVFICLFSFLSNRPSYSMFGCCCGGSDDEGGRSTPRSSQHEKSKLLSSGIEESSRQASRPGPINEASDARVSSSTSGTPIQTIELGDTQLILPATMRLSTDSHGTQLAALPSVCQILFFPELALAIKHNVHANQLYESEPARPKTFAEFKKKLEVVFTDMREQATATGSVESTEAIIRAIQQKIGLLEQDSDQVPAKLERDRKKKTSRTLIIQEGKAILIIVPNHD